MPEESAHLTLACNEFHLYYKPELGVLVSVSDKNQILDLLDQAYSVVDEPDGFSELVEGANIYLFEEQARALIAKKLPDFAEFDPSVERHINRLDGLVSSGQDDGKIGLGIKHHAQLLISKKGQILSANAVAQELFSNPLEGYIDGLSLDENSLEALRGLIRELVAGVEILDRLVHLKIERDDIRATFAYCRTHTKPDGEVALHMSLSRFEWTGAIFSAIEKSLKLSESEASILLAMLNGLSRNEIALARGRSLETVKSQAQAILRKAGCGNMNELTNLCTNIAYVVGLSDAQTDAQLDADIWQTPRKNMHILPLKDNRQLAYYEYGDPHGMPVLFLHGFMQGPFFQDSMKQGFLKHAIRVIAPSRPFFGYTSPPLKHDDFSATSLADMLSLIEHLNLDKQILIMAHHGGGSHAFRLAKKIEDRVSCLLMVGAGIPITPEHIKHMKKQSRMMAMATRNAPSIVKLLVTMALKSYKKKGAMAMIRSQFELSEVDLSNLNEPLIAAKICEGVYHISQQGAEAFIYDGRAQMADWSADLQAPNCQQFWLQGRQCPVMGAHFVEDYIKSTSNHPIEIKQRAGYNILYQEAKFILEKMVKLTQTH